MSTYFQPEWHFGSVIAMEEWMKKVVVVTFDGVIAFDVTIPCEVFGRTLVHGRPGYKVLVAGANSVDAGYFRLEPSATTASILDAHTLVIPGIADLSVSIPDAVGDLIRDAAKQGVRILSICTGAFVLARLGLLDGRPATTHWRATDALAANHPDVAVDAASLYVGGDGIYTSAGAAAGFDLCLHIVREDYGAAVAAEVARVSVMPLERRGDQSQFVSPAPPPVEGTPLSTVLQVLETDLTRTWTLPEIARLAGMSVRSLNRHFRAQTGWTPHQWLIHARVRRAQTLLETTDLSVERVSCEVGFQSSTVLRQHFGRIVSMPPSAYRQTFGAHP